MEPREKALDETKEVQAKKKEDFDAKLLENISHEPKEDTMCKFSHLATCKGYLLWSYEIRQIFTIYSQN